MRWKVFCYTSLDRLSASITTYEDHRQVRKRRIGHSCALNTQSNPGLLDSSDYYSHQERHSIQGLICCSGIAH
jgi:hypothetical protein